MTFVCPICKGTLAQEREAFRCEACSHDFPVVCGIADFRLWPDAYIGMREDREKGERLREAGVSATLVCANAEALPFEDRCFDALTAHDLIEHLRDPATAIAEARRVSAANAQNFYSTNSRYCPSSEPHVKIWGVGYLPRRWQADYVAFRRKDLRRYSVRLRSASELNRMFRGWGYADAKIQAAPPIAPHRDSRFLQRLLAAYN